MKKNLKDYSLFIILFLALILRLSYLFLLKPPLIWSDSAIYDSTAWNLVQGNGYTLTPGVPFAGREPGYALFFLSPIYFIFGHNILAVQIIQIILNLFIIFFIFKFAQKHFSKNVAIISSLFFSFYPPLIAYPSEVLTEIPFTFLLFLSVILIDEAVSNDSLKKCFLAGIILAMATLTRFISIFLSMFLIPFFYLSFSNWQKTLKYFFLISLAIIIFITPWILRNYFLFNTFIFGRMGGGEIYWSGSYIPWQGEWKGYIPPLTDLTRGLTPLEADRKMTKLAIENIKENPFGVFKIWLKKPAKMFFKSEFNTVLARENRFSQFSNQGYLNPFLIKKILFLINVLIIGLALAGILPAFKKNRLISLFLLLIIFYFSMVLLPIHPDSRYKLPLMPYIMIFSAIGFWSIFVRFKKLFVKSI